MALVLTQVYLDAAQKKALAAKARKTGRNSSELVREAVDALLLGVNAAELKQLDEASKRAEADIRDMIAALDANAKRHKAFMAEIERLRRADET
jgi:Arc/MetJ-type ribon-helix-helix transcriptional regulator